MYKTKTNNKLKLNRNNNKLKLIIMTKHIAKLLKCKLKFEWQLKRNTVQLEKY